MPLSLKSRSVGDVFVIRCVGAIVMGDEAKILEAMLEEQAPEFSRFVLDLEEVNRLDSFGMGLLVRYADQLSLRRGGIRLAATTAFVRRMLELTKLSEILPQYATEEEAIVSFLKEGPRQALQDNRGPRVLMIDPSANLEVFVTTVLTRYGFEVRSTNLYHDARILLEVDGAEYIVVGPGAEELSQGTAGKSLQELSPGAQVFELDAEFESRDAGEATQELLRMFGVGPE